MRQLFLGFCVAATPAFALDPVGTVTAYLDGADLTWEVLRMEDGATMAQVSDIGPLTMIDINAMGDGDFHINLIFEGKPSVDTAPAGITIDIRPDGATGPAWQSEGASYPPKLMLERLELDGAGRMKAKFVASLCRSDAPTTCNFVEGWIDTDLGMP
ncbi:hypothetical protein MUY21_15870 [Aliiroseovarius sp. S2029]|uniref:hypothetical protein n=1 Tax=Aliiroseovarius sp. S2029 TaxID=2936988 RepID=UPI0020BEAFAE|nr:hypothetical protein [Aliiroseovarius sp. S2029]MCK8485518.1 hypothetical protein [Aliiroseovarius sp. S2029]